MAEIEAIVFDMDGVIIDTRELISQAITDVLAARGLTTTSEQIAAVTGKPVRAMYQHFAPDYDADELTEAHMAHHEENIHLLKSYEKVAETLQDLKNNYKLGIFTGFNELSRSRLALLDLEHYFEVIVDTSQYVKHKPDPEGLLLCMSQLGVTPDKTIYVGDGVTDIVAGKAAKVATVIGITQGFSTRESLVQAGADYVIDSLSDIPGIIHTLSTGR